jgi:serpin B
VLTNAIYFKGRLDKQFDKAGTTDEDWHGPNGTDKVPMMHQKGGYLYFESNSFQALDIPCEGRQVSMLVILPKKKDGLDSLESRWVGGGTYWQVTDGLYDQEVVVSLPRFKLEAEFNLKPTLCALGAGMAFGDHADFTGISEERLKIAEFVH